MQQISGLYNPNPTVKQQYEQVPIRSTSTGELIVVNPDGTNVGGGSATDGSAAPSTSVMVAGEYNSSAPTYDNGDAGNIQIDVNGNTKVTQSTLIAGEDLTANVIKVEQRFSYLNIVAGQATTVVKAGAGFLHSITFNGPATATNTTNVYDHASGAGTIIATPLATAVVMPVTVTYDVSFATGLTIITATANGANMTISYR